MLRLERIRVSCHLMICIPRTFYVVGTYLEYATRSKLAAPAIRPIALPSPLGSHRTFSRPSPPSRRSIAIVAIIVIICTIVAIATIATIDARPRARACHGALHASTRPCRHLTHTSHTHLTRGLTSTIPHTPAVHLVQGFHAGERRPSPS